MKKILTFVLACVMLTSVFAVNVFAANTNIVGTHGVNNNISDGVDFPQQDPSTGGNIQTTVAAIAHKYAVDIEYTDPTRTLPSMVWNVQTLTYDIDSDAATAFNSAAADSVFTITNYSDLPVIGTIVVTDANMDDAINFTWTGVAGAVTGDTTNDTTATATINAVVPDAVNPGTIQVATYTLDVNCADFVTAAKVHSAQAGNKITIATYTITIGD